MTTSQSTPLLSVRALSKQYGGAYALSAVDLDIHRGEVHGLVGANGAGKSTLIRMLTTLMPPTAGSARIFGQDVGRDAGDDLRHRGPLLLRLGVSLPVYALHHPIRHGVILDVVRRQRERLGGNCTE